MENGECRNCSKNLFKKPESIDLRIQLSLLLAECVLKNNPPYVIVFLDNLENIFFSDFLAWCGYIDDIFVLCQHDGKEPKKFLDILNSYHPTIKFTSNCSRRKISFLHVEVIKKENQLVPDLYIKPTDTNLYLHASSCHVFYSKKSIPYSQALSLNRICSENSFLINDVTFWRFGLKEGDTLTSWFGNKF